MDVVLLDNRDSFVWNLAQGLSVLGAEVHVVRSDATSVAEVESLEPSALVVSPGPGRPEDAGCSMAAIAALHGRIPILGVCLGHQAIGTTFGATLRRSPPCHGKPWPVEHRDDVLLADLPSPLMACRYHSLALDPATLPDEFLATASTPEGVLMSMRHRDLPTFGLQFHPESFRTTAGDRILARFLQHVERPATIATPPMKNHHR